MATEHGRHEAGAHGPINHETTDIHLDGVAKITVGFVVFMVVVAVAMYGMFVLLAGRDAAGQREVGPMVEQADTTRPALVSQPNDMEVEGRMPAGPKLLTNEPLNLEGYKAEQARRLQSYGWVDRATSTVHLPIGRAIELIAERGLPVSEAPAVDPAAAADAAPEDGPDSAAVPEGQGQTP